MTTKKLYRTMSRTHIVGSRIGARPLDKLRPSHIDAWKVELKDRRLAESSIRTAYTVLRGVLDTAVRDEAKTAKSRRVVPLSPTAENVFARRAHQAEG